MALGEELIFGVSINNVTGITGKSYELHDLLRAGREAEAMGFGDYGGCCLFWVS